MKMETLSMTDLVKAYMQQNYAKTSALVVYTGAVDSLDELAILRSELDSIGFLPPSHYLVGDGILIIEMPENLAIQTINNHLKGSMAMELYVYGECAHENM